MRDEPSRAFQPMKPGVKLRGERSSRRSQPGDPNVSEQPSPGACVLLGMLGGGGGVPKKSQRDGERFWTPTRDNASVSAKICCGETDKKGRAREGGSWMKRGVGEWGEKSTMRHVYKTVLC